MAQQVEVPAARLSSLRVVPKTHRKQPPVTCSLITTHGAQECRKCNTKILKLGNEIFQVTFHSWGTNPRPVHNRHVFHHSDESQMQPYNP